MQRCLMKHTPKYSTYHVNMVNNLFGLAFHYCWDFVLSDWLEIFLHKQLTLSIYWWCWLCWRYSWPNCYQGSKSWFLIGESFKLQPSEFAKFATVLALAKYLGKLGIELKDLKTKIISFVIIIIPALVLLQNDTGSSLVFLSLILVLYREGIFVHDIMII